MADRRLLNKLTADRRPQFEIGGRPSAVKKKDGPLRSSFFHAFPKRLVFRCYYVQGNFVFHFFVKVDQRTVSTD